MIFDYDHIMGEEKSGCVKCEIINTLNKEKSTSFEVPLLINFYTNYISGVNSI